jgi:hypothetical protein
MEREPPRRLYLSYFGTALPEAYGVRYRPALSSCAHLPRWDATSDLDGASSGRDLLAISEMNLQGVFFAGPNPYAWLGTRTPLAVLGYSIRVYDITDDEEAKRYLAAANEELSLAP